MRMTSNNSHGAILLVMRILPLSDVIPGRYSSFNALYGPGPVVPSTSLVVHTHEHRSSDIHRMRKLIMVHFISQSYFPLLQTAELCMKYSNTIVTWFISGD